MENWNKEEGKFRLLGSVYCILSRIFQRLCSCQFNCLILPLAEDSLTIPEYTLGTFRIISQSQINTSKDTSEFTFWGEISKDKKIVEITAKRNTCSLAVFRNCVFENYLLSVKTHKSFLNITFHFVAKKKKKSYPNPSCKNIIHSFIVSLSPSWKIAPRY